MDPAAKFQYLTLKLLACKYAYYVESRSLISDYAYDVDEREWYKLGRELGYLKEDETSPCVDFDWGHPLASQARSVARAWGEG